MGNLLTRVTEQVMTSMQRLEQFGYEAFTIEDFYYTFFDELQFYQRKLESGAKATDSMGETAIERMSKDSHASTLIFWARMIASLQMRENEKDYAPFIQQGKGGFAGYLRSDVEALKSEADHLQTVALSKGLAVPITIYCLENVQKGGPQTVRTMADRQSCFDLLFRPGHYDVLYRSSTYDEEDEMKSGGPNPNVNSNSNSNVNAAADTMQSADSEQKQQNQDNQDRGQEEDTKDSDVPMDYAVESSAVNVQSNGNNGNPSQS